ncbi:hypothetical protein CGCSCA5_v010359 [Colletotrichum siamense]|nr:hypothetical protein CGCSCA5_v010359 [Colletotrichum siamense]
MGWDGRSRVSSTGPVAGVVRSGDRIEAQSDGRGRTTKRNQDVEDEQGKEEEKEHGLLIRLRRRIEGRRGCGVWSTLLTALGGQRVGVSRLCCFNWYLTDGCLLYLTIPRHWRAVYMIEA